VHGSNFARWRGAEFCARSPTASRALPIAKGASVDHTINTREVRLSAGAEFVVALFIKPPTHKNRALRNRFLSFRALGKCNKLLGNGVFVLAIVGSSNCREVPMNWITAFATMALSLGFVTPGPAIAQTAKDLAGTWSLVSVENVRPDGTKFNPLGGPANGMLVFDGTGKFSWQIIRSDIPKLASNNRLEGTPEEFKAMAQGVLSYFGSYSIEDDGKGITMRIESSSFANWNGVTQKRTLALAGDNLTVTNPAGAAGGTANVTWKRLK
jgi:hypothetical protein